jgi:hypothetical protein
VVVLAGAAGAWFLIHRSSSSATGAAPTSAQPVPTFPSAAAPVTRATTTVTAVPPATVTVTPTPPRTPQATRRPTSRAPVTVGASGALPEGVDIAAIAGNQLSVGVGTMFGVYFDGINLHDASIVNTVLIHKQNVAAFERGIRTTTDDHVVVLTLEPDPAAAGDLVSRVQFRSTQSPGLGPRPGESCTLWDNTYHLHFSHGRYQILKAVPTNQPC